MGWIIRAEALNDGRKYSLVASQLVKNHTFEEEGKKLEDVLVMRKSLMVVLLVNFSMQTINLAWHEILERMF